MSTPPSASGGAVFLVRLCGIVCEGVPRPSAGRTFSPYIKVNFDGFKKHETATLTVTDTHTHSHKGATAHAPSRLSSLTLAWPDDLSFTYTTRYPDALARKSVSVSLWSSSSFSPHEAIASTHIPLASAAAGAATVRMPMREGAADGGVTRPVKGMLTMQFSMTQISDVAVRLRDVHVRASGAATDADLPTGCTLDLALATRGVTAGAAAGAVDAKSGVTSVVSTPAHADQWTEPSPLTLAGASLLDLVSTRLEVVLLRTGAAGGGASDALAIGKLKLSEVLRFATSEGREIQIPLSAVGSAGVNATVTATLSFSNLPVFSQLISETSDDPVKSGLTLTESGIEGPGARFAVADVPKRPPCTILSMRRGSVAATMMAAPAGQSAFQCVYKPGVNEPPAIVERLFGGAPGLPTCWLRRADAAAGRVAFENLTTNIVETELPTRSEYVVTVPPPAAGEAEQPLGVMFEPNFSGLQRHGWRSGRRNSGFDLGAVVRAVKAEGYAAASIPQLRPGHHLISVNGTSTMRITFDATIQMIRSAGRPLVLRFHDPYAVPASLAAAVSNASADVAGTRAGELVPAVSVGAAALASAPAAVLHDGLGGPIPSGAAAGPLSKKTVAMANQTLDMALDALTKVDVHAPLVAAAQGDAAAAQEATTLQTALSDPGFLRNLNTVITGTARDVLPSKLNAAAASNSQEDEGGDDEDPSAPTSKQEKPQTSDVSAERALKVAAVLTAVDDAHYSKVDDGAKICRQQGVRPQLEVRARRMAELGMFKRAVETVVTRQAGVNFAGTALRTMHTIMKEYNLGAEDAGLDQSALVILQSTTRKAEYAPVMAEAGRVIEGLAAANPEQDGLAFIEACKLAVSKLRDMSSAAAKRVRGKDGSTSYILGGSSQTSSPPVVTAAMTALLAVDRRGRLLDDGAVVAAPADLLEALLSTCIKFVDDTYVVSVLLAALAKLCAHPNSSAAVMKTNVLGAIASFFKSEALASEARFSEACTTLFFNLGRDLDNSEPLIEAGVISRCIKLAHAWMTHATNAGGTPCTWPPAGHEVQTAEGVTFTGAEKYARDRNAVRPRLVRTCINVLINLACYRVPLSTGDTSVGQIARNNGVALLGELLRVHKREAVVVTSVLNCAANIAFKNRDVQMGIGATMTDGIVLAGQQFGKNANLMSMALRTIGNLTNQDANIYRGLGMGVVPMICNAMRINSSNLPLLNLAASVLSNVASVEAVDDETAMECRALMQESWKARVSHPDAELHPSSDQLRTHEELIMRAETPVWTSAAWLLLEDTAVETLIDTMVSNSTDVAVVEACLRTLMCIASDDLVAQQMMERHDVANKALFVMRAADFDVGVQLAGATLLQMLSSNATISARVAATDAAHVLCMALENHKATLQNSLGASATALSSLPGSGPLDNDALFSTLANSLDGRPVLAMQLATRVFETLQLISGARAAKAVMETNANVTAVALASNTMVVLNTLARRGLDVNVPPGVDAMLHVLLALMHSACVVTSLWAQGFTVVPGSGGAPATQTSSDDEVALKTATLSSERSFGMLARMLELATLGTGTAGDPSRPAVQLKAARALVDLAASFLVASPVLPGRATKDSSPTPGRSTVCEAGAVDALVAAGATRHVGALMLAYATDAVGRAVAAPSPDTLALTSRTLLAQLLVLIDLIATDVSVGDGGRANDAVLLLHAMSGAAAGALQSVCSRAGFSAQDVTPSPMRLTDICDLAMRVVGHLGARKEAVAAATASGAPPSHDTSVVLETESAAVFCFSVSRARQQMQGVAGNLGGQPVRAAAAGVPMMRAASTDSTPGERPSGRGQMRRTSSMRGFLGRLAAREGYAAAFWRDGRSRPCIIKVTPDCSAFLLYNSKPFLKAGKGAVKTIAENGDFLCNGVPLPLTRVEARDIADVRIGYVKAGGKVTKQTSLFGKAPKEYNTMCIDGAHGNTLVQVEFDDPLIAEDMRKAIAALGDSAA